jgi:hypothetical protein
MTLRIKIGLVFTALLAIAIIVNAIYTRIAPRPDEGIQGQALCQGKRCEESDFALCIMKPLF